MVDEALLLNRLSKGIVLKFILNELESVVQLNIRASAITFNYRHESITFPFPIAHRFSSEPLIEFTN